MEEVDKYALTEKLSRFVKLESKLKDTFDYLSSLQNSSTDLESGVLSESKNLTNEDLSKLIESVRLEIKEILRKLNEIYK